MFGVLATCNAAPVTGIEAALETIINQPASRGLFLAQKPKATP